MKQLLPLALLALAGCATAAKAPYAPVNEFRYGAISHDPFWLVSIGDDKIVLTLGPEGGRADGGLSSYAYRRVLPRTVNGVRRWDSVDGTAVISVEARKAPCSTGGRSYQDRVKVYLSGRMMEGCGGRELAGRRG
ncbi:MAG TPA: hypothetical protein VNT77_03515 [Allosphingosinicella sp.]|nr:hypothetical protein [Allosphingosinicella sp.]